MPLQRNILAKEGEGRRPLLVVRNSARYARHARTNPKQVVRGWCAVGQASRSIPARSPVACADPRPPARPSPPRAHSVALSRLSSSSPPRRTPRPASPSSLVISGIHGREKRQYRFEGILDVEGRGCSGCAGEGRGEGAQRVQRRGVGGAAARARRLHGCRVRAALGATGAHARLGVLVRGGRHSRARAGMRACRDEGRKTRGLNTGCGRSHAHVKMIWAGAGRTGGCRGVVARAAYGAEPRELGAGQIRVTPSTGSGAACDGKAARGYATMTQPHAPDEARIRVRGAHAARTGRGVAL
ncbi:hypothetical protein DFH09DRAFT_1084878 [Mycena vulgaris]|nr:hypothetical protein DFH09DRAFT_1084878 [Mycena vulgaris]